MLDFEQLKNPPLVEVILDVRWTVGAVARNIQHTSKAGVWAPPEVPPDPSYEILVGKLFDRLSSNYPFHERLPSAEIPAAIAPFMVQHRFRKGENIWPVVQIGPGILTLNDTKNYRWSDFLPRALTLINSIFDIHPQRSEVKIESLLLRYIDAEPFDYSSANALDFLEENLKVCFVLPSSLFNKHPKNQPEALNFHVVYNSAKPKGVVQLGIATGNKANEKAIIWETTVLSRGPDVPELPSGAKDWLEAAHELTHHCFVKLTEGKLLRIYSENE